MVPWFAIKRGGRDEAVLLPLTKSHLIFSHNYNTTPSASLPSLPDFSFTHKAKRITDISLLYKSEKIPKQV